MERSTRPTRRKLGNDSRARAGLWDEGTSDDVLWYPGGTYRLEMEVQGFRRLVRENIELNVDSIVRVDGRLEIGQTSESVTVTGAAPLLKTDRTDVSSTIEAREARELPLMGRNATFLMNIIPGTIPKGRGEITTGDVNLDTTSARRRR